MKTILTFLALVLLASTAHADSPSPPTSLVLVACRVDDLTGQPGRQDPESAAKNWRDLELKVIDGEFSCKRVALENLQDSAEYSGPPDTVPLHPNFSNWTQCGKVGVVKAQEWNEANQGWAVVAVGCPSPIFSDNGTPNYFADDRIVGWKLPECPTYLPGTSSRMRCRFSGSDV